MEYDEHTKQIIRAGDALAESNKKLTADLALARAELAVERRALEICVAEHYDATAQSQQVIAFRDKAAAIASRAEVAEAVELANNGDHTEWVDAPEQEAARED